MSLSSSPSLENEAKKLAATYARWLRNPEDALFGSDGKGVVMEIYNKIKGAKNKEDLNKILDLSQYKMQIATFNDMNRFVAALKEKIANMKDDEAVKFALEVFRYFQIALATKLDDMRKGIWS